MQKILTLALLLSCSYQTQTSSTPTRQSLLDELKTEITDLTTNKNISSSAPSTTKPSKKISTLAPAPMQQKAPVTQPAPVVTKQVVQKPIPSSPGLPVVPSAVNPTLQILNASPLSITLGTSQSANAYGGGYGQQTVSLDPYSTSNIALTSQAQRFINAQVSPDDMNSDAGLVSNSAPINLRTNWAMISTQKVAGQDVMQLQYLPGLQENGIILINPSDKPYTIKIMNSFAEQIDIENTGNQNPAYLVLNITLPPRSSVPLPVINTSKVRLHIVYSKDNQETKMDYPTNSGFYVVQQVALENVSRTMRSLINSNKATSNTNNFITLQQVDAD